MNKCILIIDHTNCISTATCEILEHTGYQVIQTNNGIIGAKYALQHKPDLILCDIMVPGLNGHGVLKLLNNYHETALIPIIFFTSNSDEFDYSKDMEIGVDDCLVKPFTIVDLLNAIENKLQKEERQKIYFNKQPHNINGDSQNGIAKLKALIGSCKTRQIKKKQTLYYDGDDPIGIYLIIEGSVKTIKLSKDGKEFMTGLHKANDYLGVNALIIGDIYNETAVALEDTTVCLLPKDAISILLNHYPEIGQQFLKILSNNIREKEDQMLELAYHSVRKRLAQVLLRLSKHSDDPMILKVFREELAAMAGMAMETVSRTLGDFKDEGLIDKRCGFIYIIDSERLSKMKN